MAAFLLVTLSALESPSDGSFTPVPVLGPVFFDDTHHALPAYSQAGRMSPSRHISEKLPAQVVMTKWRNPEPPDWSHFFPKLRQLWHNPKWSSSIYVDDASTVSTAQGTPPAGHLHSHLQRTAARACSICDPQAHRPFPSNAALSKHVATKHHRHMCAICLDVSAAHMLVLPLFCIVMMSTSSLAFVHCTIRAGAKGHQC